MADCCFHPIHENVVPVQINVDTGEVLRLKAAVRTEDLRSNERCCKCKGKRQRTYAIQPSAQHGGELTVVETTPPQAPCSC